MFRKRYLPPLFEIVVLTIVTGACGSVTLIPLKAEKVIEQELIDGGTPSTWTADIAL